MCSSDLPGSPAALQYFAKLPGGPQVVADIKSGRLKPGMPEYNNALAAAQAIWQRETYGGARHGGGVGSGIVPYNRVSANPLGNQ